MADSHEHPEEGAITCSHVFSWERPALLVIHSKIDGVRQVLCGQWDHEEIDWAHIACTHHLAERDSSLVTALSIGPGYLAERGSLSSLWKIEEFDEEEDEDGEEIFSN